MKKKATVTKYLVCTIYSWRVIERGFSTWVDAYNWMLTHDWGQYENDGGLIVSEYTA